jgi:hypothetical protein
MFAPAPTSALLRCALAALRLIRSFVSVEADFAQRPTRAHNEQLLGTRARRTQPRERAIKCPQPSLVLQTACLERAPGQARRAHQPARLVRAQPSGRCVRGRWIGPRSSGTLPSGGWVLARDRPLAHRRPGQPAPAPVVCLAPVAHFPSCRSEQRDSAESPRDAPGS